MMMIPDYAPLPATSHPWERIALRVALWAWAGVLPLLVLCGAMLDNFYTGGLATRYAAYHYICGGIVLSLIIWAVAVVRASPRRWRWLVCLVAVAWVGANSYWVYQFIDLVRTDHLSWR